MWFIWTNYPAEARLPVTDPVLNCYYNEGVCHDIISDEAGLH